MDTEPQQDPDPRVHADVPQGQAYEGVRDTHLLMATQVYSEGAGLGPPLSPHQQGCKSLPGGPWETSSHRSGHQKSSLVLRPQPL